MYSNALPPDDVFDLKIALKFSDFFLNKFFFSLRFLISFSYRYEIYELGTVDEILLLPFA